MSQFNQEMIDFMNGTTKRKKNKKHINNTEKKLYGRITNLPTEGTGDDDNDESGIMTSRIYNDDTDDDDVVTSPPVQDSPNSTNPTNNNNNKTTTMKQQQQQHYTFRKAFDQTITAWIEIDQQQIYPTLQSIYNLRQRIYHTYHYESVLSERNYNNNNASIMKASPSEVVEWSHCGYRHRNIDWQFRSITTTTPTGIDMNGTLTKNDIQMTIQHSLQQHERMIGQLRHSLSELSSMTNRMSRRYEDLYYAIDASDGGGTNNMDTDDDEECLLLYQSFAKELYRKQILVTRIIDTGTTSSPTDANDVFDNDLMDHCTESDAAAGDLYNTTERNHRPIQIVRQCIQEWSYTSKYSCLYPYRQLVQEFIER